MIESTAALQADEAAGAGGAEKVTGGVEARLRRRRWWHRSGRRDDAKAGRDAATGAVSVTLTADDG